MFPVQHKTADGTVIELSIPRKTVESIATNWVAKNIKEDNLAFAYLRDTGKINDVVLESMNLKVSQPRFAMKTSTKEVVRPSTDRIVDKFPYLSSFGDQSPEDLKRIEQRVSVMISTRGIMHMSTFKDIHWFDGYHPWVYFVREFMEKSQSIADYFSVPNFFKEDWSQDGYKVRVTYYPE